MDREYQYITIDNNSAIIGITCKADGIAVISDINLSAPFDEIGAPLYKLVNGEVKHRTAAEVTKSRKLLTI